MGKAKKPTGGKQGSSVKPKLSSALKKEKSVNTNNSANNPPPQTPGRSSRTSSKAAAAAATSPPSPAKKRKPCQRNKPAVRFEEVDDPIVKSPLDTHGYRMVRLPENGLKALLISTCVHPTDAKDPKKSCKENKSKYAFERIVEFNETHAHLKTKTATNKDEANKKNQPTSVDFVQASKEQQKATCTKRRKAAKAKRGNVKCGWRKGNDPEQFAVVLYIKAGFFQDPPDFPGMAHFCEHLLTVGSANFPEPEALSKFLDGNGGYCNAGTDLEYTMLNFCARGKDVDHALEIFIDGLVHPTFPLDEMHKEIRNIDSEFEGKKQVELLRLRALLQSCVVEGHPAANFGMGSEEALTKRCKASICQVKKQLLEWMGRYYCTENMLVAIQGPRPLAELETLFAKHFSKVPKTFGNQRKSGCSTKDPALNVPLPPINWGKWNSDYYLVEQGDRSFMTVSWALDPKFGKDVEVEPFSYFTYILQQEEEGSLIRFLKEKGWITMLHVSNPEDLKTNYFAVFSIQLALTVEGLAQRWEVCKAVFSYIKLLQREGASEGIYNEVRQLLCDNFHYRSDINLSDPTIGRSYDCSMAITSCYHLLQTIAKTGSPTNVLLNNFLATKYDCQVLNDFVNCLEPSSAMVVYASAIFEKDATEVDKWYGFRYYAKQRCDNCKRELKDLAPYPEFRFPKPNKFASTSACAPNKSSKEGIQIEKQSEIQIYESPKGHVTYGNADCQKGLLPSAEYNISFLSKVMEDDSDVINAPSMHVFAEMLRYVLDGKLGFALSSLIHYEVQLFIGGVTVVLTGPSRKLPKLGEIVLDTVLNFEEEVKARMCTVMDMIRNQVAEYKRVMHSPEECAETLLPYIMLDKINFLSDYVHVLENSFDAEDFQMFVNAFQSRIFVDADLNGCVARSQACKFATHLESNRISPYHRKREYEVFCRATCLPLGERCLFLNAKSKEDRNALVINYYQMGELDELHYAMLRAIFSYLLETHFDELRTKQNLGYFVDVLLTPFGGIPGVQITLQGTTTRVTCGYINEQIDEYLSSVHDQCFCSKKAFEETIGDFEGPKFTLAQARNFFQAHFLPDGCRYRKLSIQIQGYDKPAKTCKGQMKPQLVKEKVKKYSSGKKLTPCGVGPDGGSCGISRFSKYLDLRLKDVKEENGYFITDIHKFKCARPCFGNMESKNVWDDGGDDD